MARKFTNLEQLLDYLDEVADRSERTSLEIIVEAIGSRSFGPLLLLAGVILASPLSGIPGMPTTMGLFVLLIALQLLLRKHSFWLPHSLLKRSMQKNKAKRAIRWLRPPARFIDRWLQPRLTFLVSGVGAYFVAVVCMIIAVFMPVMELAPFSASIAGAVLAAFGLALIAHDGFLALFAFALTALAFALIAYGFF